MTEVLELLEKIILNEEIIDGNLSNPRKKDEKVLIK